MFTRPCAASDATPIYDLITAAARTDQVRGVPEHFFQEEFFDGPDGAPTERGAVAIGDNGTPQGEIAGFMWWEAHDEWAAFEGWVHPRWRRRRAGMELLRAVEAYALQHGIRHLAGRGYSELPGLVALFEGQGYRADFKHHMMSVTLPGRHFEAPIPAGVTLKPFGGSELEQLVEADNLFFADHVGSQQASVESWRRRMVEARPHDPSLWVIAWAADSDGRAQIVGECLCHASQQGGPKDGWVSIVGVCREWRSRGLGRAVLVQGLQQLQGAGFETASLHVVTDNTAALRLYRSQGMEVVRTRIHYHKVIG